MYAIRSYYVMFMQPGFAMVEAGFTRSKNTANILMKNLMDFCIGSLLYWFVGFTLMYGDSIGRITSYNVCYTKLLRLQRKHTNALIFSPAYLPYRQRGKRR